MCNTFGNRQVLKYFHIAVYIHRAKKYNMNIDNCLFTDNCRILSINDFNIDILFNGNFTFTQL